VKSTDTGTSWQSSANHGSVQTFCWCFQNQTEDISV